MHAKAEHHQLSAQHVAFLDLDAIFFELERFKADRAWHNFNLSLDAIAALLHDQSWYRLLIPEEELAFNSFEKVNLWREIATALLKKYCERYYSFRKKEWELPHLEYRDLESSDPNFPSGNDEFPDGYYEILVEESQTEIVEKLKELKALILRGDLKPWQFAGLRAIWFGQHLYEPLLHLAGSAVEISPVPLNIGERRFVEDLKGYFDKSPALLKDRELYLLRNMSKGRGVGFFEAGNFHPDFIIWLLVEGRQYISFVDPKGIRNLGHDALMNLRSYCLMDGLDGSYEGALGVQEGAQTRLEPTGCHPIWTDTSGLHRSMTCSISPSSIVAIARYDPCSFRGSRVAYWTLVSVRVATSHFTHLRPKSSASILARPCWHVPSVDASRSAPTLNCVRWM